MDGFTGINEGAIHAEIKAYQHAVDEAEYYLSTAMKNFMGTLKTKWASPEAAEKSSKWIATAEQNNANLHNDAAVTVDKVEDVATNIANAVGGTYTRMCRDMQMNAAKDTWEIAVTPCSEEINGSIAMDVESVRVILTTFNEEMTNAISKIEAIPTSLSVYDANGNIKASFSNKVNEIKESIKEATTTINTEIDESINNFMTNIKQAADAAASTITSTSVN